MHTVLASWWRPGWQQGCLPFLPTFAAVCPYVQAGPSACARAGAGARSDEGLKAVVAAYEAKQVCGLNRSACVVCSAVSGRRLATDGSLHHLPSNPQMVRCPSCCSPQADLAKENKDLKAALASLQVRARMLCPAVVCAVLHAACCC